MTEGRRPSKTVAGICAMAVILACLLRFALLNGAGSVKTDISSTLTDAINISELSTAEFRYRGIAEVYANEEKTRVRCRVCYSAIVKAGIDLKDVSVEKIDEGARTVTLKLPEVALNVTLVDDESMVTLPSDANISYDAMYKSCVEDAENEAKASQELLDTAQENLKATIEGLAFPILKPRGYTLEWA